MTTAALKPPCPGAERVRVEGREYWSTGGMVIEFVEGYCVFTNGRWTGSPFVLQAWQKRLLYELFEVDPVTGLRRYRRALIGIPRKNGKTELAAALGLYLMLADGEKSAQIYCAAANEDQADMVFQAAKAMCEIEGAPLGGMVRVEVSQITSLDDPRSFFKRLSSKGRTKHGLNVHGVIFDELHAWGMGEHDELWNALTTASAAREQPLQIAITTAGTDLDDSRCGGLYKLGRAIERGEIEPGTLFFRWWQAPDGCDYRDPEMWRVANPNYGISVGDSFLRGELEGTNIVDGKTAGAISESVFRRLYLNQWVDYGDAPWVHREQLVACRVAPFELRPGIPTWTGIDLSRSKDSTAVAAGQWWEGERPCGHDGPPCLYVTARTWERPRRPDGQFDEAWRVPLPDVRQHIRDLNVAFDVQMNTFDPYGSTLMRQDFEAERIACEGMHQQGAGRTAAASGMYDLIVQQRLHYHQDAIEEHIMNATLKVIGDGYYLQKRRAGKVMDAAQAVSQVVYGTIGTPVRRRGLSVYTGEDEG